MNVRNTLDVLVSVFQLRRLEHTRNTHGCLALFVSLASSFGLLLLEEQLGVVTRELLELDEEVPERLFETVDITVVLFEGEDECLYLLTKNRWCQ